MGRTLRYLPRKGCLVEVTVRTIQGRFLLRPSQAVNQTILGIVGRALGLHPTVRVHAMVALSNHIHFLLRVDDVDALAGFMGYVNGNVAKRVGRLHNWENAFWQRRYQSISVVDDAAAIDRLRYILSHGVKEGLVAHPTEWPGVHCAAALVAGTPLTGTWRNGTAEYEARRAGRDPAPDEFVKSYEVRFAPLPCWADLSAEDHASRVQALIDDIVREATPTSAAEPLPTPNAPAAEGGADRDATKPENPARFREQDPHHRPAHIKRSRAPRCHATGQERRTRFRDAYREFVVEFRQAAQKLGQRVGELGLRTDAFGPQIGYVPEVASGASP